MNVAKLIFGLAIMGLLFISSSMADAGTRARPAGVKYNPCPSKETLLSETAQNDKATPCIAIIIFRPNVLQPEQQAIVANKGAQFRIGLPLINGTSVYVPDNKVLSDLLSDARILDIQPDTRFSI